MATDLKARVPGQEPGTPAAGAGELHNGQKDYNANLKKFKTLTLREQAALWWFERDFFVLPVQPNSKKLVPGFGVYQDKITNPTSSDIGRDLYSRLIAGLRVSLVIGLAAAIFSTIIGVTVGAVAGLRGGLFDDIMMRITDVFLAFPFLVALLVVRAFLGGIPWLESIIGKTTSIRFVIVLFVLFGWMGVARLVRGQVLSLKEREFIEATRALGANSNRIIFRHLLPNSVGPILVALTTSVVAAVVGEATLSFFGFGPQPGAGQTSLGNLVREADLALVTGNWWLAVFPCALLITVAICINFIGDGLRDATDPKLPGGAN